MAECPNCGDELEHLVFNQQTSGWESGTIDLPTDNNNHEHEDAGTDETTEEELSCPYCDHTLTAEEIETLNNNHEDNNNTIAARLQEIRNGNTPREKEDGEIVLNPQFFRFRANMGTGLSMIECPHCHYTYSDSPHTEMHCPRCKKTWELKTNPNNPN